MTVVSGDDAQARARGRLAEASACLAAAGGSPPARRRPRGAVRRRPAQHAPERTRSRSRCRTAARRLHATAPCAWRAARRGACRSRRRRRGARAARPRGCGEVVLSGVNLGRYRDGEAGDELAELVAALTGLPGLARLRLSSIEPLDLTRRLLEALAHPAGGAPPARAAAVGRRRRAGGHGPPATRSRDYRAPVAPGAGGWRDLAVTTDVIVGFPTRGRGGLRAHAGGDRAAGRSLHARARLSLLAAAGYGGGGAAAGCRRPSWQERMQRALAAAAAARAPPRALARAFRRGPRRGAPRRPLEGIQFAVRALLPEGDAGAGARS